MHSKRAGLTLLALLALLPGCGSIVRLIGHPTVRRVQPRVSGINFESIELAFDIHVRNPYFFALKTPRCRYGLHIEGIEFARGEAAARTKLPARDVGVVSLPVRLKYANLLRTYRTLARASKVAYTFRGELLFSVLTRPVRIPISHSDTFPILRVPRFHGVSVRFSEVSLERVHVCVEARVENTNAFEIDVHDVGFELRLGDASVARLRLSTHGTLSSGQTGHLTLTGEVCAGVPLARLLDGKGAGKPRLIPSGFIKTPYRTLRLQRKRNTREEKP